MLEDTRSWEKFINCQIDYGKKLARKVLRSGCSVTVTWWLSVCGIEESLAIEGLEGKYLCTVLQFSDQIKQAKT